MKVLLLNYADSNGGAAIASLRLTQALRSAGIDAELGVIEKSTPYDWVIRLERSVTLFYRIKRKLCRLCDSVLFRFFRTSNPAQHSLNLYSRVDVESINKSDYDIVHLNWINNNMISIKDIAKIKKPIVWTMHDTWLFCGAENYPNVLEHDSRYITGYTARNKPSTTRGLDLCRYIAKRKQRFLGEKDFAVISPSHYEKEEMRKSFLFSGKSCTVIPNVIDKSVFRQQDKNTIRSIYGIPKDKKIIGFGAAYNIADTKSVKGGDLLLAALRLLEDHKDEYFLVLFGPAGDSFTNNITIPFFAAGYIANPHILSSIYCACDVFVSPSIIENLSLAVLEAAFCGIPVTAFHTGGTPDIVEHKTTGYLAQCFDPADLSAGIKYCLDHQQELSRNALDKSVRDFVTEDIVSKHVELYNLVLARSVEGSL